MRKQVAGAVALVALMAFTSAGAGAAEPNYKKPAGKEWLVTGGDWGNSRYTSLTQINASTVKQLGGAWTRKFQGESSRAIPVVHDGLMFITTVTNVYALNPRTGETVWAYQPPSPINTLFKGVALGDGKIFLGLANANVVAIEEKTGKFLWEGAAGSGLPERDDLKKTFTYQGAPPTGQYISAAPTYADGKVIVSIANGDYGIRGRVAALDAKTGKLAWAFNTVPEPGEFGHDTWQQDNDVWKRGGAGVWGTPVIDADLGMLYFNTGNPIPYYAGEMRAGDNLFSDSIVALDLKTGKRKWHFQVVHHDIWEYDLAAPLLLYEGDKDGKKVKGLAAMRVDGFMFLLDRATGKPIIPVEERPARQNAGHKTSATQPYPVGADQTVPNCVDNDIGAPAGFELSCFFDPVDLSRPNVIMPTFTTRLAPMSYNPQTQYIYVTGGVGGQWHRRWEDPWFLASPGGPVPGMKRWGILTAIDTKTDKIAWQKRLPLPAVAGSGTLSTASGLVLRGDPGGAIQAYDAKTGDLISEFQTGFGVDNPLMSFELDGQQHLAFVATDATVWTLKVGGPIAAKEAPTGGPNDVLRSAQASTLAGRIGNTGDIGIGLVVNDTGLVGPRQELDEYRFAPARTRVKAGAKITWTNNGKKPHQPVAQDGSWAVAAAIDPGKTATVTIAKPGSYVYFDKLNPFIYGEIIVE